MLRYASRLLLAASVCVVPALALPAYGADEIDLQAVKLTAPDKWVKKEPRSKIIAYEFAAPAAKGDSADGRFTVMAAGGSIEDNINRWIGQFSQPDGKNTKDRTKISKKTISGVEVHLVDIAGTYKDQPGPFAPGVDREKYRMLAAILVAKEGQFFFKFYGPEQTVADHEKAFSSMIDNLKAAE